MLGFREKKGPNIASFEWSEWENGDLLAFHAAILTTFRTTNFGIFLFQDSL